MLQQLPPFEISRVDPREPEAAELIRSMTEEIRATYDLQIDGHGHFKPEDVLVPGSGFLVGRVGDRAVACGAFRPLEPGMAEIKRMFVAPEHRGHGYRGDRAVGKAGLRPHSELRKVRGEGRVSVLRKGAGGHWGINRRGSRSRE